MTEDFLDYIASVKRYSPRTVEIYRDVLQEYQGLCGDALTVESVRDYELWMLDERKLSPRSVSQHLSVLSAYCKFLVSKGTLASNPVHLVKRPKVPKRLPELYRSESMQEYFKNSEHAASQEELDILLSTSPSDPLRQELYERRLRRLIITLLYSTGMRRAELIALEDGSADFSRLNITVHGKGDKTRIVPLTGLAAAELKLYLLSRSIVPGAASDRPALLRTFSGRPLYPVWVDRAVKQELGEVGSISTRRSPHVLRHTLATELLDNGTDLNSIKELLGHSSLAATQVYTHNSIEKMRAVYNDAHPRAKKEFSD